MKLVLIILAFFALPLSAQTAGEAFKVIAPLKWISVDSRIQVEVKEAAAGAWQSFANQAATGGSGFDGVLSGERALIGNLKNELKGYRALSSDKNVLIEPIVCQLGSNNVAIVQVSEIETTRLLSVKSRIIPFNAENLREELNQFLIQNPFDQLVQNETVEAPRGLKISINNRSEIRRTNRGSQHCLNLLLQEALMTSYQMTKVVGLHRNYTLARALKLDLSAERANRNLSVAWTSPPDRFNLPFQFGVKFRWSDGVFGTPIMNGEEVASVTLEADGLKILDAFEPVRRRAGEGQRELKLDESPQIAKVYRAWVYLDKGRGWGLKMNDRVLFENDPNLQGHVVGFYGSKMGVVSPKGYKVNEGAIIFVRKGQRIVKVGDSVGYDSRIYP